MKIPRKMILYLMHVFKYHSKKKTKKYNKPNENRQQNHYQKPWKQTKEIQKEQASNQLDFDPNFPII